jgi:hypothetical protein
VDIIPGAKQMRLQMLKEYNSLIEVLGGVDLQNSNCYSIKDIINSDSYQTVWHEFWTNKQLTMCAGVCGTSPQISKPKEMFIERNDLDSTGVN